MNIVSKSLLGICATSLIACSQPPAPIAHKGDQFYGKKGARHYAAVRELPKPDYTPPVPMVAAPLEPMKVADLDLPAAPEKAATAARPAAFETATFKTQEAPAPQLEPLPLDMDIAVVPKSERAISALPDAKARLGDLNDRSSNFIWPVQGKIVSRFGPKKNGLVNDGINIAAREGEPIWAAADGVVAYAGNELKGYGNMMIIRHANGWMTAYAHSSDMLVEKDATVEQGDLIGYVGKTGAVKNAQLHFGIREGKTPVDPENLLPRRLASAR